MERFAVQRWKSLLLSKLERYRQLLRQLDRSREIRHWHPEAPHEDSHSIGQRDGGGDDKWRAGVDTIGIIWACRVPER